MRLETQAHVNFAASQSWCLMNLNQFSKKDAAECCGVRGNFACSKSTVTVASEESRFSVNKLLHMIPYGLKQMAHNSYETLLSYFNGSFLSFLKLITVCVPWKKESLEWHEGEFLNYSFNIPCFGVYTYSVCIYVCVNMSAGLQEMDREREGRSRGAYPTWCGSEQ